MKPYPFASNRFNVDRCLDQQLLTINEGARTMHVNGISAEQARNLQQQFAPRPFTRSVENGTKYRGWAVRLDAWSTRQLDRVDWPRIDIWLGTIGGFAITGVVAWFIWVLADAWMQGRFSLGGN
jgi:hypothetical protein